MADRASSRVVDPQALPEAELEPILAGLLDLHLALYSGVDRRSLRALLLDPGSQRSRLQLVAGPDGRVLACTLLHLHEQQLEGRPVLVLRIHHARRRYLAGPDTLPGFLASQLGRLRLAHPGRTLVCVGLAPDPGTFALLHRTLGRAWPAWDQEPDPALDARGAALAAATGLEPVAEDRPLLLQHPWPRRLEESEARFWRQGEDPAATWFLARCPAPERGQVLLVHAQVELGQLASSLGAELGRRWQDAAEALQALGLGTDIPVELASALLQESQVFEHASQDAIAALAGRAERRRFGQGKALLRQGTPPDAMLVLVEGRAQVLLESAAGEEPLFVGTLGPGSVLGEMGLLTGEPRSATVVAMEPCTTLWLSRRGVLAVLAEHEELAEEVWRVLARRRLDSLLIDSRRFQDQEEAARQWLVQGIRPTFLAAGGRRTLLCPGTLFLVAGELEVEADFGWCSLRGPALLPCVGPADCLARTDTVIAVAPPLRGLGG